MVQTLQNQIVAQSNREVYLKTVELPPSTSTLFNPLLAEIEAETRGIDALMVLGLEAVRDLDNAIAATNQVREEFRKYFHFPVILWIDDRVLPRLIRYAPDFKSWAAATIKFEIARQDAITLWWQTTDELFKRLLALGVNHFIDNATLDIAPGCPTRRELEYARADIYESRESLTPFNCATWEFILGRDAFAEGDLESALTHYQNSLNFWQRETPFWPLDLENLAVGSQNWAKATKNPFLEQKALILFHIALCYGEKARTAFGQSQQYWQAAKDYLGASWEIFAVKNYEDLVAQLTLQLGEVLYILQEWHELESLALYSLQKPLTASSSTYTARAYGFLTQVALGQGNEREAEFWVMRALETQRPLNPGAESYWKRRWLCDRALYLFLHSAIQTQRQQRQLAINDLEQARRQMRQAAGMLNSAEMSLYRHRRGNCEPLYLDILEALRSLYFQQQQYAQAFEIKKEKLALEQSLGLRSFQGAAPLLNPDFYPDPLSSGNITTPPPEIAASGRDRDIQALCERFFRSEHKLTIVHGASGTGKSSLLYAGLVPTLWGKIIAAREVVPVIQNTYNDWESEFQKALQGAIAFLTPEKTSISLGIDNLPSFAQLQYHAAGDRLFVLIFDQFEEFFWVCPQPQKRHKFYQFLRSCLELPFIKILLCLREDYLHYLLAIEENINLDCIDNNLLDRRIRYRLTDLQSEAAINTIELLAARSQFHLEPALIRRIVQDLSNKQGFVRPVELQVIGAALQAEKITNLTTYKQLGPNPKAVLVKRSLLAWVADCGVENAALVWQILYTLTNNQGMRPIRTLAELQGDNRDRQTTDLILKILIGSGLVYRVLDDSEDRFQLVHDYLVAPIRVEYESRRQQEILTSLRQSQIQVNRAQRQRWQALALAAVVFLLAIAALGLGWLAQVQRHLAFKASQNAELLALSSSAEALLASHKPFESLLESLQAVGQVKRHCPQIWQGQSPLEVHCIIEASVQLKIATVLEQALHNILEYNQLQGHSDVVWHVRFAPQHHFLASAARDRTVKLWQPNGKLIATLQGHLGSVTSVDINQDGLIASSGWDGAIYLWQPQGVLLRKIPVHKEPVYSVRFSPDGQYFLTTSADNTARIWTVSGQAVQTLNANQGRVYWASYSPDNRFIATAGEDGTIALWTAQGELLRRINAHRNAVNYVSFSPDNRTLASASHDTTAKLWTLSGDLLQEFQGHTSFVYSVEFSPDGQTLATASEDRTIRLWNLQGQLLKTLRNHSDGVTTASFSPDGKTLASSSQDKTVKLWATQSLPRVVLQGHEDFVLDVAFSQDERTLATASRDRTVKLWHRQGQLIATLKGHGGAVNRVRQAHDGQLWASASDDGTVKLWRDRGTLVKTLHGHTAPVLSVAWSQGDRYLATSSEDNTIKIWTRQGQLLQTLDKRHQPASVVAFSEDSRFLVVANGAAAEGVGRDRSIELWYFRPQQGLKLARTFSGHENWVTDLAFLPQSNRPKAPFLVSAGYDNSIKFWNRNGQVLHSLNSPTDSISRLSLHPSGQVLATTAWDDQVRLWRLDDTLLHNLSPHSQRIVSAIWNRDGTALATASHDQTAIVSNFDLRSLNTLGCEWLADYLHYNTYYQKRHDGLVCEF